MDRRRTANTKSCRKRSVLFVRVRSLTSHVRLWVLVNSGPCVLDIPTPYQWFLFGSPSFSHSTPKWNWAILVPIVESSCRFLQLSAVFARPMPQSAGKSGGILRSYQSVAVVVVPWLQVQQQDEQKGQRRRKSRKGTSLP